MHNPFFGPGLGNSTSVSSPGSMDAVPSIQAALAAGKEVVLTKGGLYTFATTLLVESFNIIRFNGATITVTVPQVDGITGAAILCYALGTGTDLTLSAPTTVGARSFSVTAMTDLVADGFVVLTDPAKNCYQAFKITSITGAGPFTVNIDRRIGFVFPTADTYVYAATIPEGIILDGGGATFIASPQGANVMIDRGFELGAIRKSWVEGFTFEGAFGWGVSFDTGSYKATMRDICINGLSTRTVVGYASENNEDCVYENIAVQDVKLNSLGGAYVYSGIHNRHRGITIRDCTVGFGIDTADVFPSDGCVIDGGSSVDHCGTGMIISDGSKNWKFHGLRIQSSTNSGVLVNTNVSGAPTGLIFDACDIFNSGNSGVLLSTGTDIDFINCKIQSSGSHGLEITAGVTKVSVVGGRWDSNTGDMIRASDDVRVSGLVGYNNTGGGIRILAAANAYVVNAEVGYSAGSTGVQCYICNSTGFMSLHNCRATASGTTGTKSAMLTTSGVMWISGCVIDGSSMTFGLFRNGGGTLKYDETLRNGGTTVRTGGTLTTTGTNENSYG